MSGVPVLVQGKQIRLGTMRLWVRSLALLSGLRSGIAVSCGVGHRHGSDPSCCGCGVGQWLQLRLDP